MYTYKCSTLYLPFSCTALMIIVTVSVSLNTDHSPLSGVTNDYTRWVWHCYHGYNSLYTLLCRAVYHVVILVGLLYSNYCPVGPVLHQITCRRTLLKE